MSILAKKLLMSKTRQYTLTIITDPIGATCTLTVNGVSYNTKSIKVNENSVVVYSVYHATYGTAVGSLEIDSDKTLYFLGSYASSETEQGWNNPILQSDNTPGGSTFAAFADSTYSNRYPYLAFDGQTGINHCWESSNSSYPHYLGFYNPNPIKFTSWSFIFYYNNGHYYAPTEGYIEGSNNGINWTQLKSWSTTWSGNQPQTTITDITQNYYNYYRFYMTKGSGTEYGSTGYVVVQECFASGKEIIEGGSYYWKISSNPVPEEYTLSVITTPSSANCTLTYNGLDYQTKVLTVPANTVIHYVVSDSTYGVTTDSITMDSDKTITCIGKVSESYVEHSWTRPNLTSNGTMGTSDFAVYSNRSNNLAYFAVDGKATTFWSSGTTYPAYWECYIKEPLKVTEMTLTAYKESSNVYQPKAFEIQGSNDNSSWTTLFTKTASSSSPQVLTATLNNTNFWHYYRIYITRGSGSSGTSTAIYTNIAFTAVTKTSTYVYYWDKTIT